MPLGVKEFSGKLRWTLYPFKALHGCIRVFMCGAQTRYNLNEKGIVQHRGIYVDEIFHHLNAYVGGEEFDLNTGESHLSHVQCEVALAEADRMERDSTIPFENYISESIIYEERQKWNEIGEKDQLRWSLYPFKALQGCIRVLMYGAQTKYAPNNWMHVDPQGVYLDAVYRHLITYLGGEEFDPDTGESHLSHILCDVAFLEYHRMHRDFSILFFVYLMKILFYPDYQRDASWERINSKEYKAHKET